MSGFQTRITRTHHESHPPQNRSKNKACRECGQPPRLSFDPATDEEEDPYYFSLKNQKPTNNLTLTISNYWEPPSSSSASGSVKKQQDQQQKSTSHLHHYLRSEEPSSSSESWCNRNFTDDHNSSYYSNKKNNFLTRPSTPSESSSEISRTTTTATVIFKVSVSTSQDPSGVIRKNMPTTVTMKQNPTESRNNSGINNVTILNAGNLDRDRDHLISINTNNSDMHKQTIRVKNMPSSSSSQNHGQCGGNSDGDNNFDFNVSKPNITTVSTNPADRIVLQIHSSSSSSASSSSSSSSNNNNNSSRIRVHNSNFNNSNTYASTVNPNVNYRKTLNNIESDSNLGATISTVFHSDNHRNNTDYNNDKCSPPSSVYPDSDIIISSSRSSSTRSGTGLIQNNDDDDDYLPTSLPHSIDDIINTNSNNTKITTAEVFANSIAYPTTAKSDPHCPNCNGVVPLSHLETISETAASKIEHGFWNHNYNNFHTNLHRESSFHSYGGFTLNGQPGYLKPNKHKMRRFCSSHKVAFVVSTFSLLVTIGLIITLLLMKKKGMMEAM